MTRIRSWPLSTSPIGPDGRRQHAAEVAVPLGEAEAVAARRRRRPDRQMRLSANAMAASQPPPASMSGPATNTGFCAASTRAASCSSSRCRAPRDRSVRAVALADGLVLDLGGPVVHRDRDERRALRRQRGPVDRLARARRDVGGARHLVAPLHERLGHLDGVAVGEVRVQRDQVARLLPAGHEQRRLVGLRVEDRADALPTPGAVCRLT